MSWTTEAGQPSKINGHKDKPDGSTRNVTERTSEVNQHAFVAIRWFMGERR
jgi:hypothetical protein